MYAFALDKKQTRDKILLFLGIINIIKISLNASFCNILILKALKI